MTQAHDKAMSGDALMIPGRWLQRMSPTTAVLLAYLTRWSKKPGAHKDKAGWFQCDARLIQRMTGIPTGTQTRLIHDLVERQFLETRRHGNGARRQLKINWEVIAAAVEERK